MNSKINGASDELLRAQLVTMLGLDIAGMVDLGIYRRTLDDLAGRYGSDTKLTHEDIAAARALMFVLSGSALLDGDVKAIKDAPTLYRVACAAHNCLVGSLPKSVRLPR